MKTKTDRFFAALGFSLLAGVAQAEGPREFNVFHGLREASDHVLDQARGRFINSSGVITFGVVMESQWSTNRGSVYGAGLELQIGSQSGPIVGGSSAPQVSFQPSFTLISNQDKVASVNAAPGFLASREPLQDASGNTKVSGSGLENVTGVAQGIHVAADANRVNNTVSLDITLGSGAAKPEPQPVAGSSITSVQVIGATGAKSQSTGSGTDNQATAAVAQAVTDAGRMASGETLTVTTEQGAKLSSGLGREGAVVAIELPGEGRILQSIGGGILSAAGIRQNVEILSQLNTIQNSIRVIARLQDTGSISSFRSTFSQHTLQGLRQIGSLF